MLTLRGKQAGSSGSGGRYYFQITFLSLLYLTAYTLKGGVKLLEFSPCIYKYWLASLQLSHFGMFSLDSVFQAPWSFDSALIHPWFEPSQAFYGVFLLGWVGFTQA